MGAEMSKRIKLEVKEEIDLNVEIKDEVKEEIDWKDKIKDEIEVEAESPFKLEYFEAEDPRDKLVFKEECDLDLDEESEEENNARPHVGQVPGGFHSTKSGLRNVDFSEIMSKLSADIEKWNSEILAGHSEMMSILCNIERTNLETLKILSKLLRLLVSLNHL